LPSSIWRHFWYFPSFSFFLASLNGLSSGNHSRAPRKITNSQKSYGYKKTAQEAAGRNKAISTPI
jgi:hypothetical protein